MKYLVVVPARAYPIDDRRFAIESALCGHLQALLSNLSPPFTSLSVVAVGMSEREYQASRAELGVLDAERDRVRLETLYEADDGHLRFARRAPSILRRLHRLVRSHDLVHAGPSHGPARLVETVALGMAAWQRKPSIGVTDVDRRTDARMSHRLGRRSLPRYVLSRALEDPLRHLQQRAVVRMCSLVLFEDDSLYDDYAPGRPNVRFIRDPGFSARHLVAEDALEAKIATLLDRARALELVSFGRLTPDEGVDHGVEAVARVIAMGEDVRLTIVGAGEEEPRLRALVCERGVDDRVTFRAPLRDREELFEHLRGCHLTLRTPLVNDTPTSSWSSLASGVPILAYDTRFHRGLARVTRGVETVSWCSIDGLAARIAYHARHREALSAPTRDALRIARENTAERWLSQRARWTRELLRTERSAVESRRAA